ncbi:MAG: hypothetical protein QMD21_00170 [Candidatus Thermoplasmatota archaeon]|nr:hypothetical protein [Candidatus Thermoplasmatota archaeon]
MKMHQTGITFFVAQGYTCWVYGDGNISNYPKWDGYATEYNIKQILQYVLSIAGENDIIAFVSSGHGGYGGANSAYLCMWDSGAGESGEDGNLWDYELAALFANSKASRNFIFLDHCYSGGFIDNIAALPNNSTFYCTTTCTVTGLGYDVDEYQNGAWTYWFLEWGLVNGNSNSTDMEGNFAAAWSAYYTDYINWGTDWANDQPMQFDGNPNADFYL